MIRLLSFTNLVGLAVLIVGIWALSLSQSGQDTRQLNLPGDIEPGGTKTLKLHFASDSGLGFKVEARPVQTEEGEDLLNRAMAELVKGPQAPGAAALVPAGTPAPTVFLRDNTAYVDLPAAYGKLDYGTVAETQLIYGIATTLLEFKEVSAVKFMLDGKDVESLGHLSLVDPFKRQQR
ncbi:MAG: hypothetical protein C4331_04130 [Meiothermus sp.]